MKKALISPQELVEDGVRIAEIRDEVFDAGEPLYWIDVPDDTDITISYYMPGVGVQLIPERGPEPEPMTGPPPWLTTSLQFMDRFTEEEQISIAQATMTNAHVKLWYDRMLAANEITLFDPRVSAGIDALIGFGLLAPERKADIMDGAILITEL